MWEAPFKSHLNTKVMSLYTSSWPVSSVQIVYMLEFIRPFYSSWATFPQLTGIHLENQNGDVGNIHWFLLYVIMITMLYIFPHSNLVFTHLFFRLFWKISAEFFKCLLRVYSFKLHRYSEMLFQVCSHVLVKFSRKSISQKMSTAKRVFLTVWP